MPDPFIFYNPLSNQAIPAYLCSYVIGDAIPALPLAETNVLDEASYPGGSYSETALAASREFTLNKTTGRLINNKAGTYRVFFNVEVENNSSQIRDVRLNFYTPLGPFPLEYDAVLQRLGDVTQIDADLVLDAPDNGEWYLTVEPKSGNAGDLAVDRTVFFAYRVG